MSLAEYATWRKAVDQHQVQTLLTTVGSNPLPALVVSRLVVAEGGTVVLCGTEQVRPALQELQRLLKADGLTVVQLIVPANEPHHIHENVAGALRGHKQPWGLDYTGGTKAMAVFANEAVSRDASVRRFYLDARELKLRVVKGALADGGVESDQFVGDAAVVGGRELLALHRRVPAGSAPLEAAQPSLPRSAAALAKVLGDRQASQHWREFIHAPQRGVDAVFSTGNGYRDTARADSEPVLWPEPPAGTLADCLHILTAETNEGRSGADIDAAGVLDPAVWRDKLGWGKGAFLAWLTGLWLEHHVVAQIAERSPDIALRLGPQGFRSWLTDGDRQTEFEIDVLALRGYQLHAFSCTTSAVKPLCKQKLFEARLRASQLGGDEARVCLVCASDEPAVIRREVANTMGDDRLVTVCGAADLPRFGAWYAEQIRKDWPSEDRR
ncbi:MAG: hypothetical protein IT204_15295 [Fimbriimonadaceae bacterium]|nr:hypothetical protein [Fimbriimonadaceae bacterium]